VFSELKTIGLLWPEVLLILAATTIFVGGTFQRSRAWWSIAAVVAYLAAGVALASFGWPSARESEMSGPLLVDPLSLGLRWTALLMGLVFTLSAVRLASRSLASEYIGTLMLLVVGVMLTASANDLVFLFLGLELISIPTYVLLFLGRRDRGSAEATMKYFFLSILSSALLLYGFSFLYGLGGTTIISGTVGQLGIREAMLIPARASLAPLAPIALVLIMVGMGFRLAAAPFQFYAPDVYQGTTNVNAGILAVAPKIAGIAALIRLVVVAMPSAAEYAWQLAIVLAVLTMTIGNICALWQSNIRRLLAYSSIAHGGYLLIGLATAAGAIAAPTAQLSGGVTGMLFYVIVYALATMGAFVALAYLSSERHEVSRVDELAGLARTEPAIAGAMAIFMFSLAGIPPLAGFWGKFTLFGSAVEVAVGDLPTGMAWWFTVLAIVGALNAAIAAAYYLRIVAVMYFQPVAAATLATPGAVASSATPAAAAGPGAFAATILCAILVIGCGLIPSSVLHVASQSERQIATPAPVAQHSAPLHSAAPQVAEAKSQP
jgi:NADH-quinone oxidoreductase subunit N